MSDASRRVLSNMEESLNLTQSSITGLRSDIHALAINSADMIWLGSDIYSLIRDTADSLEKITEDYLQRRVNLKELAKLTNNKKLANLHHAGSVWNSMTLGSREKADQFHFKFKVLLTSEDAFVYKTTAFNMWTGWPHHLNFIKYTGPEYTVHNRSDNILHPRHQASEARYYRTDLHPKGLDRSMAQALERNRNRSKIS